MKATTQERQSINDGVFEDPDASREDVESAAGELEERHTRALVRLRELQAAYPERSLKLLSEGSVEEARGLAIEIEQARKDEEQWRVAIDAASAKLARAAREKEDEAEKTQWERVGTMMQERTAIVTELAQCVRRAGELYRTQYALADEIWHQSPRKPTSNRNFVPFMDPDGMRNEFELYLNQATGGLYPGLGELVPVGDLIGSCSIGHAHMLSMKPAFGMPAGFVVNAGDLKRHRLGTGAVLDQKEGWRMPDSRGPKGIRLELGEPNFEPKVEPLVPGSRRSQPRRGQQPDASVTVDLNGEGET